VIEAGGGVQCVGVMQLYAGEETPVVALRNVDLDVEPGELVAILGPSGSGKSTLLSLLSGLLRPTAGSVQVAGHDLGRMGSAALNRLRATDVALLLQDPLDNLLPYATAAQNVRFAQRGARRRHWPLRWSAGEILAALGLEPLANRPMTELSGGQQQQVAVATVLAASPRVLLADEPTAHLDPMGRQAAIAALQQANRLSGATTIVVTHDPVVAAAMRRTVTISNGHIGSEGRGGREFVVIGRDGTVALPAEVLADHPAGTLLSVHRSPEGIVLRPEEAP
jgi:putative ABC transport system ATP-binding protein